MRNASAKGHADARTKWKGDDGANEQLADAAEYTDIDSKNQL